MNKAAADVIMDGRKRVPLETCEALVTSTANTNQYSVHPGSITITLLFPKTLVKLGAAVHVVHVDPLGR